MALLILLCSTCQLGSAQTNKTDSHGRRWSQFFEPPPPDPDWDKVRQQQLTVAERLSEFGVMSAEYKVTASEESGGLVELLPEGMQISVAALEGGRLKLEMGTALPKLAQALQPAMAKVSLEFSADAPIVSEVGFEGPVSPSTKITANVKYDQIHDPNWAVGVEIQKLFAKFKGEFADGAVNRVVEISLVNLFNTARGLATPNDLPRDLIIKIDTVRFYNAVVKAVKESAATSESRSKVVKGLFIRFNPVLMVAAMRNDPSLLAVQKAFIAVQQRMAAQFPKGVKIRYDDDMLAELLRRTGSTSGLASVARDLTPSPSADSEAKISRYIETLTSAYRSGRTRYVPRELVVVSLRRLVTEAEQYRGRWSALPESLAKPGGISRIVGYRIDADNDDVYLIGVRTGAALSLDEIIDGLVGGFRNDDSPFCSLDPDPVNPAGVQTPRVGGVPFNSTFARTMLDADYLMKKINIGLVKVDSPAYKSIDVLFRGRRDQGSQLDSMNRFWFYPVPLSPGDIEVSSDGAVVFFGTGMQVLSEQMVRSQEGLVGTGTTDPIANELASGFTKALADIETKFTDIGRLHGLFDVVLLGRVWRQMNVKSQWIDRLTALPTTTVPDKTYEAVSAKVYAGATSDIYATGGVRLRTSVGSRAMLVTNDRSQKLVRAVSVPDGSVATQIEFNDSLPSASGDAGANLDTATITRMIAAHQFDSATVQIDKLLSANPFDATAWCLRAENDLQRSRFVTAIDHAERALELAPDDLENLIRASVDLFAAHFMLGENEDALDVIRRAAEAVPDSLEVRLFYAEGLAALGKFEEARTEFRLVQRAFPHSSEALVRFGVFEISEGNLMSGKQLIDRANKLSKTDQDVSTVDSALSLAEVGMAVFESPEIHLQNAETLANKVLADTASGPISRLRALNAKSIVALARDNVSGADSIAQQVLSITPANPTILLSIAEWSYNSNRSELALKYLERAEKIAPNMPLVKALAIRIRGAK